MERNEKLMVNSMWLIAFGVRAILSLYLLIVKVNLELFFGFETMLFRSVHDSILSLYEAIRSL